VGVLQDITERKQFEETLRESEERYRLAVNATNDGIWDYDLRTGVVRFNDSYTAVFGRPSEHAAAWQWWTEHVHPEDRDMALSSFNEAVHSAADVWKCEYRFLRVDGTWAHAYDRAAIKRDDAGRAYFIIGAVADMTERKAMEAQLQQAQKMESVGRLAGGVAHDFNNMLGVIIGHTEMALDQVDAAQPLHEDLTEIHRAARRSADLTRQLLTFARKQSVAPRVLDLNETLSGMLKMLARLIGEDIALTWRPAPDLWPVKMDPSQLDQILANLCVNARDAISGVGHVTIETGNCTFVEGDRAARPDLAPGEYVRFSVTDTGCGMERETLEHVFEPFFTTKAVGQGTGLGLSTVYGAVKQNDGFIEVASQSGHGTTFTIYVPRALGKAGGALAGGAIETALRGHETILLVEDERTMLRLTTAMLERQGYTVLAANTPGEAINRAQEHRGKFDLLLTDVVMPEMNGRDLSEHLLALYPGLRLMFMSGYTLNAIAQHGALEDGVSFIQKPFGAKELAAKVRGVLDRT
jgi:PAS domain S-box-containing protein